MDIYQESLTLHQKLKGKISIEPKQKIETMQTLSLLYSPGVSQPCMEIKQDPETVYDYTIKGNTVAVVTNGSAVLGLGNIGALASIPVMEGKAALFKSFADINAFPICLDTQDPDEIIRSVEMLAPVFGGINLEDIKAPECFYIEKELKKRLDIPVFHDDQHGTAIVVLAGLVNALKVVKKNKANVHVIVNGMGSAGTAIAQLLVAFGICNLTLCDYNGIIFKGCLTKELADDLSEYVDIKKQQGYTMGTLESAFEKADVFIGVSAPNIVTENMIKKMNEDAIVFALANPNPEITVECALKAGAKIVATGRSDYPNQVNNVLVFPGLFKGALSVKAKQITQNMKISAVNALANLVLDSELTSTYILPNAFDLRVVKAISEEVANQAIICKVV